MNKSTERLTIRLPFSEMQAIKQMAKESDQSVAEIVRSMINDKLNYDKNLNQKMLVEILMILRSQIKSEDLNRVLQMVDAFKKQQGIE
ncbi:ribbon-helix-helix protein, CopG family [Bathymodiolus thermophilus thioautotrophic gill symbiont]|uniref:Ribbon-helix-helix protein CopG domain-containing protein n=1 Tax=Bathymodiolus thermophilus thioautotrophic gill symbiont TaxID=2360 RepID=A0A1J5UB88_9GAMM|nr:ribbon-helix-helix protein, CopG family [Bathymodiolus thermophilus thioautotrophic gill symbiont]AYQ57056.1 hypothetical protein MS2017_1368 [Bathymodiolus thermophilus thioautotrophic gill symbiont]OIR25641.1 hypothetical protein BGC33_13785 [Bathymodiolus thermophilus thioautotrophic gill symbiont]